MASTLRASVAVVVLFGLAGMANADFQVFTDQSSYAAALAAGGAGTGAESATASVADFSDSSWTTYTGPSLSFTSLPHTFVGVSGFFNFLTSGTIDVSLDGSQADSISDSGFFGIISWLGFKLINFDSDSSTTWEMSDPDMAYDSVVPEPTSLALFGMGALGLIGAGARRRRKLPESVA